MGTETGGSRLPFVRNRATLEAMLVLHGWRPAYGPVTDATPAWYGLVSPPGYLWWVGQRRTVVTVTGEMDHRLIEKWTRAAESFAIIPHHALGRLWAAILIREESL